MKKRLFAALLTLVMVLSMLPVSAMAVEAAFTTVEISEEERAQYDELLAQQFMLKLTGLDDVTLFSTERHKAGDRLDENSKKVYDAVAEKLRSCTNRKKSSIIRV